MIKYIRPFIDQKMYKSRTLKEAIHLAKLYGISEGFEKCPICGKYTFGFGWICKNCGWETDTDYLLIENPDQYSFANYCSINEYKEIYKNVGKNKPLQEYWNYRNNNMK